jgi:murein L,D-transpeptidase YafK
LKPHSGWVRALLASAAIACAIGLAGCQTDGTSPLTSARAMAPLSPEMLTLLEQKNMPKESPILVRIFKEEAEMEVWKQDAAGQYALLKTYPICRWSGELGPKIKEGDRQAPEGFYTITPGQMNPNSNWYLSFNLGFPNAYDRANGRTGAFLMVHGDCSSAGCYAMTDEQMGEIYALGREAFFGGQKSFQVQAYPFRMTAANLARHRNNPAMPFWRMIKEGNDIFELTRHEPKVDVCEKRYVFAAESSGHFDPKGRCPAYTVPDEIASALSEKQQRDERDFANLAARGTPTAPIKTGADGGMNKIFLAKLRSQDKFDEGGRIFSLASTARVPDMGNNVNPPKGSLDGDTMSAAVAPPPARVASADGGAPTGIQSGPASQNAIDRVSHWLGFGAGDPAPPRPAAAAAPVAKPKPAVESKSAPRPAAGAIRPTQATQAVERRPAVAPTPPAAVPASAAAQPAAPPPTPPGLIAGAQPMISSNSFETRWSAWH